jgi:hypothetical protein
VPQEVKKQEDAKPAVTMDDVMKRIEALQKEVLKPKPQAQRVEAARYPTQRPKPVEAAPAEKKSPLPDPVMDPEGYTKALTAQVLSAMREQFDEREQRQAAKEAAKTKSERLWKRFSTAYPDHAKNKKLVEFMAGQVIEEMALDGADLDAYINEQTDDFFSQIAAQIDETVGKREEKVEKKAEEAEKVEDDKEASEDDDDENVNYGELFGGDTLKASKGKKGKAEDEEPDGGIVALLRDTQRKAGYY